MAKIRFLLQEREGQKDFVYRWTPVLAAKKDMRPISMAEAKHILDKQRIEKEKAFEERMDDPVVGNEPEKKKDPEDSANEENKITSDIPSFVAQKEDSPKPLSKSMEDIKKDEIKKIRSFRKANLLEAYLLEKYKLELIPGDLPDMKDQAEQFISELARAGKLYEPLS